MVENDSNYELKHRALFRVGYRRFDSFPVTKQHPLNAEVSIKISHYHYMFHATITIFTQLLAFLRIISMDEEELLKLEKLEVQRKQLDKTKEEEKAAAQVLKYLLHQIIIQY